MSIFVVWLPALGIGGASVRAAAQSVDAVVHGCVKDSTGSILPGATITLTNVASGVVRSSAADDIGRYRLPPVPPGIYELKVEHAGFRPQIRADQRLYVGMTVTIDVTLDAVTLAGAVDVTASSHLFETGNALSRVVRREEIDSLPVVDRNFNGLAILAPGVTATGTYGGVDIGGSRDFQNGYNVDGASAESLGAGEQRVRYAQDWIEEFQVLTTQYNVEFGRASGGILNAVTRSGSNVTSGRAYAFFRNRSWDATPAFAVTKPALVSTRVGATAGGKLVRDRLFFFSGFEWFDDETSRVVNSTFAELNGSVPAASDQKVYLVKIEQHRGNGSTYRIRYNGETSSSTNVGVGGRVTEEQGVSVQYNAGEVVASWNRVLSASAFNELRAAFSATSDDRLCNYAQRNPPGTWFTLQYVGAFLRCPGTGFGRKDSRELQLIENFSWTRGPHDIKAGALASRSRSAGDFRFLRDGLYLFQHPNRFDLNDPATYPSFFTRFEGDTTWSYPRWSWGLFVQDSWRLRSDLTVNAGVRYDLDGSYTALNPLIPPDKDLMMVRRDRDNIAPRVGVTWNVDDRTMVRGGAGVYYDENHSNIATLLLSNVILVDRAMLLNAMTPEPPFSNGPEIRRFLAEALARNTAPDMTGLGARPELDPNLQVPYSIQASGGMLREFRWNLSVSVDGVYARGLDQYVIRDVNLDRDAALSPTAGRIVRMNPGYSQINRYGNDGSFEYRALQIQVGLVPRARHVVRASYTWSKNESNTRTALEGAAPGVGATNPFNLSEDFGPADSDIRHNLSLNWVTALPFGVQFSGILSARTALPWSVATRQLLPTEDPDPFVDRVEPRNSRRGDEYFSLDARLSRAIRFSGRRVATAFVEAFNVTNETNLSGYLNNSLSPETLGRATSASDRRRIQIGFRVDF